MERISAMRNVKPESGTVVPVEHVTSPVMPLLESTALDPSTTGPEAGRSPLWRSPAQQTHVTAAPYPA